MHFGRKTGSRNPVRSSREGGRSIARVSKIELPGFSDLLFPRRCVVCDCEILGQLSLLICPDCQMKLGRNGRLACNRCGATRQHLFSPGATDDCPKCRGVQFRFDSAISMGDYEGTLREVIIRMKQPGQETLIIQIGRWLGRALIPQIEQLEIDAAVAMPSFWTRHFSRGLSVSWLLCDGLSREVGLEVLPKLLKQIKATRKQGTLSRTQRLANVKNAFRVRSGYCVEDQRLLLVDDVMSSGATINEAARVLKKAGARSVTPAFIARGVGSF